MQSEDTPRAPAWRAIDRVLAEGQPAEAIAAVMSDPLRALLGVPFVEVHRLASGAGAFRIPVDVEALRRGTTQRARAPDGEYAVVPLLAGRELVGAISFGGPPPLPEAAIAEAQDIAPRLAFALRHANVVARLQEANAQLAALNRELESFSYSVSHDLRAPLRAIDGYARMLERESGERLGEEGRRLLGVVRSSAHRMGRLIDDLLELSRVGQLAPQRMVVDMTGLAHDAAAELGRDFPAATVRVADLPQALGDPALLRRVWLNLIGNALKFSSRSATPTVEIGGAREAAGTRYWVRDNGVGFDIRYAGRLFGAFQRLHRQEDFPGSGVGLAIVQRIVSRHGGRAWAEGAPGSGACFSFVLPST